MLKMNAALLDNLFDYFLKFVYLKLSLKGIILSEEAKK